MVYRIYSEKKQPFASEASFLLGDIRSFLGIKNLEALRILNRYDIENISPELFESCKCEVFSEPAVDDISVEIDFGNSRCVFAVEYLPGQFDQRADSAAQCVQIISCQTRPEIRTARVYVLYGNLSESEINKIKGFVINPVDSREASLEKPDTLAQPCDIPESVDTLGGFIKLDKLDLDALIARLGLAMDADDIKFCQDYFIKENRNPTISEIRMIDTYWSDHCRHTTFLTTIDSIKFEDENAEVAYKDYINTRNELSRKKPINLMDIATLAAKSLVKEGILANLDASEEINACTVKVDIEVNGKPEKWLLLFKNETHNHPTEIEPFGGAATCIGGAIRDPLSGRSYVYAAMRITGAGNPLTPIENTLPGKLSQRKLVTGAAQGYSSYGNQIGLATGIVDEIYHDGYVAKHMEIGAVVGATPQNNVRRLSPEPGDKIILLGGRTGRDGCGGATGSSKSHSTASLKSCGAEVQKGNAPEERKLQRLMRNPEAASLIKRCNDFGAGGVSVAIGELADGLLINLNKVPKKYEGLDGTELAISESQERMAVVVSPYSVERFCFLAEAENLEATVVAEVIEEKRLQMLWNDKKIIDISRDFLDSNGAEKHIDIEVSKPLSYDKPLPKSFSDGYISLLSDLNVCSKRGLSERFDSTIGAGTVLMPFGGKYQATPIQAMVHKIPVLKGKTDACSAMAWGYNPYISEKAPFNGAYVSVLESVCKLVATGAGAKDIYLTLQEFFEKPMKNPKRWGKPAAALLGAFRAQKDFGIGAIGGKDSMSGSFESIDVPPTLVSFAVSTAKSGDIISPEFKCSGSDVYIISPEYSSDGLPSPESQKCIFSSINTMLSSKAVLSVYTPGYGGIAEAIYKMSIGNGFGFDFDKTVTLDALFCYSYGSFITELPCGATAPAGAKRLGKVTQKPFFTLRGEKILLDALKSAYESKLESVYPVKACENNSIIPTYIYKAGSYSKPSVSIASPKALIPVFPGTNCEYDSARAIESAGITPEIFVIKNLNPACVSESVKVFAEKLKQSQILFIPGGFSGGDEPEGSGKFITAFFRNAEISEALTELLELRDGLVCGICNGFQALIKLGLVPFGKIIHPNASAPTLTFNTIGRHQSRLVRTRVASDKSPWLMLTEPGEIYTVPISHGEGRFVASPSQISELANNGQIATQYVDFSGMPTSNIDFCPNNSAFAIEGITSPDGRVLGKMGHSERIGNDLYKNVPGNFDMRLFSSAAKYFK